MLQQQLTEIRNNINKLMELTNCRLDSIIKDLDCASKQWPDHQMRNVGDMWFDRESPTPKGSYIWASDGISVWLIFGDGGPIPESATRVRFWTHALIPHPPGVKEEAEIRNSSRGAEMKIMLDASPNKIREKSVQFDFDFWQLRTPLTCNSLCGKPYGLDNGCFSGSLPRAWFRLLREAEEKKPVFVAMPDVVGSARRTADLFDYFEMKTNGLPRALVLQDGIGEISIPWCKIDAVFVGGSDKFKTSQEAFAAARCAKMLDKWVHVGRVNEPKRLQNWIGVADSIDGSGISRFDHMLDAIVRFMKNEHPQAQMEL